MEGKEKEIKTPREQASKSGRRVPELETALVEMELKLKSTQQNEKNLLSLLESMDDLIFVLSLDGILTRFHQSSEQRNLFLPPKKFIGKHFRDVLPQETAELLQKALNAVEAYGKPQEFDYPALINNQELWFSAKVSPYVPSSRDYFGYVLVVRDITERKRVELTIRENEEKYRAVMQQSTECIFLADIDTRVILEANKALQRLLGYSLDEIPGLSMYDFMPHEQEDIYQQILQILKERSYFLGERKYRRKDGTLVDVEISVSMVSFRGKKVLCVVSRDITPRKLAERQLTYTATHDPLTGLVNRLLLYDRLAQELARARRNNKMIGLVYIDLDRFKEINDSMGHSVGDQLLKAVGTRLKSLLRESDTLARMGGDEYMFILGDIVNPDDVERIVKNVLASFHKSFELEGIKHHITASVGISLYPVDGSDSEVLIKAADLAMYYAKSEGRDNFKRYSSDMKVKDLSV